MHYYLLDIRQPGQVDGHVEFLVASRLTACHPAKTLRPKGSRP